MRKFEGDINELMKNLETDAQVALPKEGLTGDMELFCISQDGLPAAVKLSTVRSAVRLLGDDPALFEFLTSGAILLREGEKLTKLSSKGFIQQVRRLARDVTGQKD